MEQNEDKTAPMFPAPGCLKKSWLCRLMPVLLGAILLTIVFNLAVPVTALAASDSLEAVSYTHLDVYKRQVYDSQG